MTFDKFRFIVLLMIISQEYGSFNDISPVTTGTDIIEKTLFCLPDKRVFFLEATPGFEPGNQGFADPRL
ncbi:MAG: hypothetical protein J1F23_05390, partial [Oscillospiraceae bacterium]|nr:hypothetical protein [Oscillospiraceae bacterium]